MSESFRDALSATVRCLTTDLGLPTNEFQREVTDRIAANAVNEPRKAAARDFVTLSYAAAC